MKIKSKLKQKLYSILPSNSPDFIVIGAQKAGTSSLHNYLNQHPKMQGSSVKELHYFDIESHFKKSLTDYENNFKKMPWRNLLFFESSPSYIYHESVAEKIATHYPDIKLILILRDPIKRAFSAWNMYRDFFDKKNVEPLKRQLYPGEENPIYKYFIKDRASFPSLKECLEIEVELIAKNESEEPAILRRGLYYDQLQNYYQYFNEKQILILAFKELVGKTSIALDKIYNFLDVPKISIEKLTLDARNKRTYKTKLSTEDFIFLKDYYQEPNEKLFELLGERPNW